MTDAVQEETVKMQETIRSLQDENRSLKLDVMTLDHSYKDELQKNINFKRQIFSLSSDIEILNNKIKTMEQEQKEKMDKDQKEKGE